MSSLPPVEALRPDAEEGRRLQLIETTLDSLAEVGFVGSTLSQIAGRANVSPGLVAHYFGDKDGLLDAAFRTLTARVGEAVTARLKAARSPRDRVMAVIDANLDPKEFDRRTGTAWLAFWGQAPHAPRLRRACAPFFPLRTRTCCSFGDSPRANASRTAAASPMSAASCMDAIAAPRGGGRRTACAHYSNQNGRDSRRDGASRLRGPSSGAHPVSCYCITSAPGGA